MGDLRAFGVPALILSGGEPLLRPDLFATAQRAKALGSYEFDRYGRYALASRTAR